MGLGVRGIGFHHETNLFKLIVIRMNPLDHLLRDNKKVRNKTEKWKTANQRLNSGSDVHSGYWATAVPNVDQFHPGPLFLDSFIVD